jgi:hypothetical protein
MDSFKTKYHALVEVTKESLWLCHLLEEMGFPFLTLMPIFYDNQSCIKMVKNIVLHMHVPNTLKRHVILAVTKLRKRQSLWNM